MYNFIPLIIPFLNVFIISYTLGKTSSLSRFVVYCYLITILFSIALLSTNDFYSEIWEQFYLGSLYFSIILTIFLYPYSLVRDDIIIKIRTFNVRVMLKVAKLTIFLSFISISYFTGVVIDVFSSPDLETFRHILVNEGHPYIEGGLINSISGVVAMMYLFPMYLAFIFMAKTGYKRIVVLLFISSLSYPLYVLAYFGRDGVVFWILGFLSLVILMKPFLIKKVIQKLYYYGFFLSTVGAGAFLFITFTRFGSVESGFLSIIDYLGQQFLNFCVYFELPITNTEGARSFSLIHDLLADKHHMVVLVNLKAELFTFGRGYMSWTWGTMFKDLYTDLGTWGALILVILWSSYQAIIFATIKKNPNFITIFFLLVSCQIAWQGIFYFKNYSYAGNIYLLVFMVLPMISIFCDKFCRKAFIRKL